MTLLAIDDDPLAVELLRVSLAPAGFTVLTAGGGAEGLEMARLAQPALIILDLNFDQAEPLKLVGELKSAAELRSIPLIGFLSHVQAELKQKAQEALYCRELAAD